jgi:hypothetical protein
MQVQFAGCIGMLPFLGSFGEELLPCYASALFAGEMQEFVFVIRLRKVFGDFFLVALATSLIGG